jgi:hypothetical protein
MIRPLTDVSLLDDAWKSCACRTGTETSPTTNEEPESREPSQPWMTLLWEHTVTSYSFVSARNATYSDAMQ